MALTEDNIIDSIEVLPDGQIQVRRATRVYRNGAEIAKTYHRHVIAPGDDLSVEDARVRLIAGVVHSPSVIRNYIRRLEV